MDLSNRKLNLQRAATHVHKPGYKFPVEKRIEVVTKWMALGNMRLVAELTGVSYQLCRMWKQQPWWKELEAEIRASRNIQTNNKLSKLVDRSLDMIADRLENGDFVFNQKTGEVVRKEISLRDVNVVAKDLMTQQINLQKQEKEETVTQNQVSIQDQLKLLAQEFAKFNGKNTGPVSDAVIIQETTNALHDEWETGLQEGSGTLHLEACSEEEESYAECSSSGDGEGGFGEEGRWEACGPQDPAVEGGNQFPQ